MPNLLSVGLILASSTAMTQSGQPAVPPSNLALEKGVVQLRGKDFSVKLGAEAGIALELRPTAAQAFDFLPSDRLARRSSDGFVHLGDLSLRARESGTEAWTNFQSFRNRSAPSRKVSTTDGVTDEYSVGELLTVVRNWKVVKGALQLSFTLTNSGRKTIEVGSLGLAMPFNNIIVERSLEEAHAVCSFTDPYIGQDAGFLRVTQLSGSGSNMVVTPLGKTPLEAWNLVREPMGPNQVFEGMMEWMVHTKAHAQNEWKGVEQWNEPTEMVLEPGQSRTYGVQFTSTKSIREIEETLASLNRPVAVSLPGTILPMDQKGKLFLKYPSPAVSLTAHPKGSLLIKKVKEGSDAWQSYSVEGKQWGRSRLTVSYQDGTVQTVSYYVTKPAAEAVSDMGRFLTTKAWFDDKSDPFGRAPSPISYDREADSQVLQDSRVWIAGLGDEGGSGNWVALAMKLFGQPKADEVRKFESFIDGVLWGNLQFKDGPNKYGVRKSVFYYDPAKVPGFKYDSDRNWTSWTSWNKQHADEIGRGYNYPHVVAAYWSMYKIARSYPNMVKSHDWKWYLNQAFKTTEFMTSQNERGQDKVGYWRLGLMEGTIFANLLDDLRSEGWRKEADIVQKKMLERASRWRQEAYPFGSEMPWDSTGQEEVYIWCRRFGFEDKAQVTLNSILSYMPTVPHWGYNGNARRYWDFLYGGKLSRIERQIHHYGSGLNAIPLLTEFRDHPDDLYLLRVGYGGAMGALSNIDRDGFASAAFHSFPSTLKWDAYSGDYGPNFFGHALNTGTYLVKSDDFGWQAFGGNISRSGDWVRVDPKDSFRRKVFIAPSKLTIRLDSGQFSRLSYNHKTQEVRVSLEKDAGAPAARLRLDSDSGFAIVGGATFKTEAGAHVIPFEGASREIVIKRI